MANLIGGAALGAIAGELLKAVVQAIQKSSNFQSLFDRLQSTLATITGQLDAITRLNKDLDIKQQNIDDLYALVSDGKLLVQSCSDISRFNYINKIRYQNKLIRLEKDLKNFFTTLFPLDHYKNDLAMHVLVKELHNGYFGQCPGEGKGEGEGSSSAYVEKNRFFLVKKYVGTQYDLDLGELKDIIKFVKECNNNINKYRTKDNKIDIFVKSINLDMSSVAESEFHQRMENIGKIGQHKNVKLPFGYFSSKDSKFLLYEYMPGLTLHQLLLERKSSRGNWKRNIKMVLGAATGISHIHSCAMIHGNINSTNVILTRDYDGCISDFGLLDNPEEKVGAPELKNTREATQKSDVYDFGVVLMSVISIWDTCVFLHPIMLKEQIKIKKIGYSCTNNDPAKRPAMDNVILDIRQALSPHLSDRVIY